VVLCEVHGSTRFWLSLVDRWRKLSENRTENGWLVIPYEEVVSVKYFQFEDALDM
jgi:hypothetical protein